MARLTKDQVFDAIKMIKKNGDKPTSKLILDFIGSGSFTTITKYLREYDLENIDVELGDSSFPINIPNQLQKSLSSFANQIWSVAKSSAEESVEKEKQEYEYLKQQNKEQLKDAIFFAEKMQFECENIKVVIIDLKQSNNDLKAKIELMKISNVRYEVEVKFLKDNLEKADLIQGQCLAQYSGINYLSSEVQNKETVKPISLIKLLPDELPF